VVALLLTLTGCEEVDSDEDGTVDSEDCSPHLSSIHPGALDLCDGVDDDCDGVDGNALPEAFGNGFADRDLDGFGDGAAPLGPSCERLGVALAGDDCDDSDAQIARASDWYAIDADFDAFPGTAPVQGCPAPGSGLVVVQEGLGLDCDDHNGTVDGYRQWWGLDEDGDGSPSELVLACSTPTSGGIYVPMDPNRLIDCAPHDASISPYEQDDCEKQIDMNCDGEFDAVRVLRTSGLTPATTDESLEAAIEATRGADAVTAIVVEPWHETTIDLCPGRYRVRLTVAGIGWAPDVGVRVVGHGTSPDDVVLDANGTGTVATIGQWWNLDWFAQSSAYFENLTFANGSSSSSGGCLRAVPGIGFDSTYAHLALVDVVFDGCSAARGGAIAAGDGQVVSLTDVIFRNTTATQAGGAIDFMGTWFSMRGGGFESSTTPTDQGNAIAATLEATNGYEPASELKLEGVGLGAIDHDLAISVTSGTVARDLGDNASIECDPSGCTP